MHRLSIALAGFGIALLAACGGGGDESTAAYPPADCDYRYTLTGSPQLAGDDPLLTLQWHLENVGQSGGRYGEDIRAKAAWTEFNLRGENVRVAVVDDAIETVHHDLAPNLAAGAVWDYRTRTATAPLPCYASDDHGTAVTGIILARDGNAFLGAGVAPRAGLAAYNALATSTDADIADALTRELDSNAIYNNSWGSPDNGMLNRAEASFVAAVRAGLSRGRSGKGAIYVFPGGNGGCYQVDRDGNCVAENSNYDGYVNQLGVIAACAVDDEGKAPLYAEPGANLLVCGPSGNARSAISTTDVQNGFRRDFSGTSASTPMISGAAALVLSARPDLSWRDVRLILAYSARRNDPFHRDWQLAGARPFNPYYGFGAADAQAALRLAQGWQSVGGSESLIACPPEGSPPYTRGSGAAPFPIDILDSSLETRTDSITVGSDCAISRIEFIEIGFSANHPYSGDLRIDLVSPLNRTNPPNVFSRLADGHLCDPDGDGIADNCGNYDDWRFGSVRHLDESAQGTWQLAVTDVLCDDPSSNQISCTRMKKGQWSGWSLRFWGRR